MHATAVLAALLSTTPANAERGEPELANESLLVAASEDKQVEEPLKLFRLAPTYRFPKSITGDDPSLTQRMDQAARIHQAGWTTSAVGLVGTGVGFGALMGGFFADNDVLMLGGFFGMAAGSLTTLAGAGISSTGTWMGANALRRTGVEVSRANGYVALGAVGTSLLVQVVPFRGGFIVDEAARLTLTGAAVVQILRGRHLFNAWDGQFQRPTAVRVVPLLNQDMKGTALVVRF